MSEHGSSNITTEPFIFIFEVKITYAKQGASSPGILLTFLGILLSTKINVFAQKCMNEII